MDTLTPEILPPDRPARPGSGPGPVRIAFDFSWRVAVPALAGWWLWNYGVGGLLPESAWAHRVAVWLALFCGLICWAPKLRAVPMHLNAAEVAFACWLTIGIIGFAAYAASPGDAPVSPRRRFAIVSGKGKILWQEKFSDYGLTVERRMETDTDLPDTFPFYYLSFAHAPADFEVRTDAGATVTKKPVGPNAYRVWFQEPGFGGQITDCDFRVEATD